MSTIQQLEMKGITKSFHGISANQDIHLQIHSGEILGLLGENGAGKTTLMNILYGLYQPDSGEILINGTPIEIASPQESIRHGIGMVHQHFMLVQNHTVAENIALGYTGTPFLFPQKKISHRIRAFSQQFNFNIDPDQMVWQLSAGEQQRVEIVKALINGADLLILDEPTSVLTPKESIDLFNTLKEMQQAGHSIIIISHKLDEILDICDRVTVLQKGNVVGHADTANTDKADLARMMVGRDIIFNINREALARGPLTLSVENLQVLGDKGNRVVNDISFNIYQNEIFGIAGVAGNGQKELVEAITGIRPALSGSVFINQKQITNKSPREIYNNGIAHIPEERIRFGIAPSLFIYDNAILKQQHRKKFAGRLFLEYRRIKDHTRGLLEDFGVAASSINMETKNLSGGNIQKLILGREISKQPSLLVAAHPTYGLDVGATEYLRKELLKIRKSGGAVLLISEDLEEIFELSDRIAVIFQGRLMGIVNAEDADIGNIGLMMAGSQI